MAGKPIGLQHLGLIPLFLQMAAIQLWMPTLFWLLTWPSRLRGVAPITFAALLVFGLAPFAGSRLTAALAATEAGTPLVLKLGVSGMFVLIALPVGWLAWKRLHRLARDYDAKRFSDAQLLARTWWVILVATVGLEIDHAGSSGDGPRVVRSCRARLRSRESVGGSRDCAPVAARPPRAPCCCCACSALPPAPSACSTASALAGGCSAPSP